MVKFIGSPGAARKTFAIADRSTAGVAKLIEYLQALRWAISPILKLGDRIRLVSSLIRDERNLHEIDSIFDITYRYMQHGHLCPLIGWS